MNYEEIQIHGDSLYQIILDSVFTELMTSACDFYGQFNSDFWFSAYDKGNTIIIKNGIFVSEMLKLLPVSCLKSGKVPQFTAGFISLPVQEM